MGPQIPPIGKQWQSRNVDSSRRRHHRQGNSRNHRQCTPTHYRSQTSYLSKYFNSTKTAQHSAGRYVNQKEMMSLPGLGLEEPEDASYGQGSQSQTYELSKDNEWRFEVALGRVVNIKITTGTAEIFGTELVLGRTYTLQSTKAAIYTWTGCAFEVSSEYGPLSLSLTSEYIAEETPINEYISTHFALEGLREQAVRTNSQGPRVLVLGPDDAGKTTLCKTLTGYAVRSGRSPVVVNLDPAEGVLSLPGTLTATVFKTLIEVEEGWGNAPMSGPNGEIPVKLPLVYYYGSMTPEEKGGVVFRGQNTRLALAVQGRLAQDQDAKSSGIIIDTPGSLAGTKGYDIIAHIVSEFGVNCIICIGSERLYSDMVKKFDGTPTSSNNRTTAGDQQERIAVIKLSKSGGVADRDLTYMRTIRDSQVKSYFYGNPRIGAGISLQPRQQQVDFDTVTVWRRINPYGGVGNASMSHGGLPGLGGDDEDSFLPGGGDETYEVTPIRQGGSIVPLPSSQIFERLTSPIPALRNCVLAVLNCDPEPSDSKSNPGGGIRGSEQDILRDSSVMGFLYVTDVDESRGRISLLSPVAGRVPNRALVWGEAIDGVLGLV